MSARCSAAVLLKRGPLTADEYEVIKQHTVIGDRLCGEVRWLRKVRPIVRHHHERLDGSGYPDGLRGDAIPLLAQIMSTVDIFDALTSERPYRAAMPAALAAEELQREVARNLQSGDDRARAARTLVSSGRRYTEMTALPPVAVGDAWGAPGVGGALPGSVTGPSCRGIRPRPT